MPPLTACCGRQQTNWQSYLATNSSEAEPPARPMSCLHQNSKQGPRGGLTPISTNGIAGGSTPGGGRAHWKRPINSIVLHSQYVDTDTPTHLHHHLPPGWVCVWRRGWGILRPATWSPSDPVSGRCASRTPPPSAPRCAPTPVRCPDWMGRE